MAFQAALYLLLAVTATAHRGPRMPRDPGEYFYVNRLKAEAPAQSLSELKVVETVLELEKGNASSLSSMYVHAIQVQESGDTGLYSRLQVSYNVFWGKP